MKKLLHALEQGASEVHVRTVDSDIITILIEKFHEIQKYFPSINLIVAFDIGKTFFYYSIKCLWRSWGRC